MFLKLSYWYFSAVIRKFTSKFDYNRSLDAVLAFRHCTLNSDSSDVQLISANESASDEHSAKRRLRSHKNAQDNEFIIDLGAVAHQSNDVKTNNKSDKVGTDIETQMSSLSLLRQLLPTNMAVSLKTRELLQDILAWQILPSDAPAEPSMIYGAVHLSRLIVKLPDFVNATPMSDDKLKLLLQYLGNFIEYVKPINLNFEY